RAQPMGATASMASAPGRAAALAQTGLAVGPGPAGDPVVVVERRVGAAVRNTRMKRRYLVISELFLPTKGGTAVWFDEVYRRLGDRGTHIMTARVPGCEAHDRDHANQVHRLRLYHSRWLRP